MNKSLLVQIIDSGTNLYEEIKRRILAQKLLFTDEVKQIAFRSIFERQIYGGFVLKARVEPTNVLMIELFLDPNFSYQRFFDLTGRQRCLLDLLDSNLDRILFVAGQLYFTIWTFTQIGLFGLNKLQITFVNIWKDLFYFLLFWRQEWFVIRLFDERSRSLYPLHIAKKDWVTRFWHLPWTFKLMDFKPILLKASLTAIFDGVNILTLGTSIIRNKLLIQLSSIARKVSIRGSILLIFQ